MKAKSLTTIKELAQSQCVGGPIAGSVAILPTLAWAHWFIMLLFLAVETAPVLVKLISQRGPYDYVLKKEEYGYEAAYYEDLAKLNATIKKRSTRFTREELDYVNKRLQLGLENT